MSGFVKVARCDEIPPGTVRMFEVNGKEIAVYNVDGAYYATTNICPHQGGPLAEGTLEGRTIVCPWHAWAFDVVSGSSPVNPRAKIETYPVRLEGKDIFIDA
ncbi:MAG: non-heme iron oxygenase ferredoxin subunit [Planctomycetes bacterium]|nr:non-heme iron oxygenase ferredoxin subunit [Planctomycetota bacterium]